MSINNVDSSDFGLSFSEEQYEEFEDILEYDKVTSTDALIPTYSPDGVITEEVLRRDIASIERLRVEEVRWFYRSNSKKKWKPFIGSDSINIELEWRCIAKSDFDIKRVCVRGGMYEVDVVERKCFPVYWSSFNLKGTEDSCEVTRGTWFYDGSFMPLDEQLADRIEAEHLERWKGICIDDVKHLIGNSVMHSVKLQNCHVDWNSVNDVYVHSDAVSYRALRNIVQKLGASKTSTSGSRLRRGYCEDAMHEDCMPPVEHLVFVVHGIGAKPDRHKIVRNTDSFRLACHRVAAKHFTHYTGRVEFLPVEWRSKLILNDVIVDTITPKKGQGMRQFLNNNLMDIMYYTSPVYRGEIVDGLKKEIRNLHSMFLARNPDFTGKVSIFAHSLGSVIMHDIMTGWSPESLFEEYVRKQYAEKDRLTDNAGPQVDPFCTNQTTSSLEMDLRDLKIAKAKVAQLEARTQLDMDSERGLGFYVHNLFCVGSPLAIFLSLRGVRPGFGQGTQDDILPRSVCNRIFNIFHPADPVAYRLEPIILAHYSTIAPLQVHWHNALHKTPYDEMLPKPYLAEAARELSTISSQDPSGVDPDSLSGDVSDPEDSVKENDEGRESDGEVRSDQPEDLEKTEQSPQHHQEIARRSSYLKTISGGAYKVGKALWSRARGSSPTNANKSTESTSPDTSLVSEQEMSEINFDNSLYEREGSASSSRSCSPAPKTQKSKFKSTDPDQQSDTASVSSVNLEHRLDYELMEGFTESRLGYASITSHTSYWGSQDVALFVLMQIHPKAAMVQSMHSKY